MLERPIFVLSVALLFWRPHTGLQRCFYCDAHFPFSSGTVATTKDLGILFLHRYLSFLRQSFRVFGLNSVLQQTAPRPHRSYVAPPPATSTSSVRSAELF